MDFVCCILRCFVSLALFIYSYKCFAEAGRGFLTHLQLIWSWVPSQTPWSSDCFTVVNWKLTGFVSGEGALWVAKHHYHTRKVEFFLLHAPQYTFMPQKLPEVMLRRHTKKRMASDQACRIWCTCESENLLAHTSLWKYDIPGRLTCCTGQYPGARCVWRECAVCRYLRTLQGSTIACNPPSAGQTRERWPSRPAHFQLHASLSVEYDPNYRGSLFHIERRGMDMV